MPSLFIGASRSISDYASLYIRLDISKYSNVCWKEFWCFNYLQSCIFQYEFVSNKHANRNFVNILNYVITFHDQAIPRKNPPVKPPARYTFSAANSWNCSKPFWKKEQRSFNKRPNSICYSYYFTSNQQLRIRHYLSFLWQAGLCLIGSCSAIIRQLLPVDFNIA